MAYVDNTKIAEKSVPKAIRNANAQWAKMIRTRTSHKVKVYLVYLYLRVSASLHSAVCIDYEWGKQQI